ncbi:uncharacterized protein [Amphiura filiformis]|uniref:uncharacterized protein n=1 Tax=Amphiura filiformis TaxID=82378 RepID=UPI003B214A84
MQLTWSLFFAISCCGVCTVVLSDTVTIIAKAKLPSTVESQISPGVSSFQNLQVTEGDTIELVCKLSTYSLSNTVEWTHNNNRVSRNNILKSSKGNLQIVEDFFIQEWTLTISGVSAADAGQWKCIKSDWGDLRVTAVMNLDVLEVCVLPMGMENGRIPDSAITASFEEPGFEAFNARLNNELYWSGGNGQTHWIQIDLGKVTTLTGVVTQGERFQEGDLNPECVSQLSIQYAMELTPDISVEDQLTPIEDEDGNTKIFDANTDVWSSVTIKFPEPIEARYIRIIPQDTCDSNGVPRMRFELIGCPVVDVLVELEQGRGTLTRDENSNYDLKVFPGESITLVCAPEELVELSTYRWKREPDTILYNSHTGIQISESDPYFERMRFEPRSPSRWDVVWRLGLEIIGVDETFSFSCSSRFGQSTINVTATLAAIETVDVEYTGEGELSSDKQTFTVVYGDGMISGSSGIRCTFYGANSAGAVRWYRDDEELMDPEYEMIETETGRVYELSLTKGFGNGGNYTCVAEDGREGSLNVKIHVETEITAGVEGGMFVRGTDGSLNTLTVPSGTPVTLTCTTDSMPPNPVLKWFVTPFGEQEASEIPGQWIMAPELSENIEANEWSLTLRNDIPVQGAYTCALFLADSIHTIAKDTVYLTASESDVTVGFSIALRTEVDGLTRAMRADQTELPVSFGVGDITLICRATFFAKDIKWIKDGNVVGQAVDTIPGYEHETTFEYRGFQSNGAYKCEASDPHDGNTYERVIGIIHTVRMDIAIESGRSQLIERPDKTIVTAFKGETITLSCTMVYPDDDFKYLRWHIGSTYYNNAQNYYTYSNDPRKGRLSFRNSPNDGVSYMTLSDIRKEDENTFKCGFGSDPADPNRFTGVELVVGDEMNTCEYECYPDTGSWDGNCFNVNQLCDGQYDCSNFTDEADCPDIECPALTQPDNGWILEGTTFTFGSNASFICNPGYVLYGSETIKCQDDGTWTNVPPVCGLFNRPIQEPGCPKLTRPENGYHFDLGNGYGMFNHFLCRDGYGLKGDSQRYCRDNGTWSGEPAECFNQGTIGTVVRLARGNAETVNYLQKSVYDPHRGIKEYNWTVFTVKHDAGSLTFSCRFPGQTVRPRWTARDGGTRDPIAPIIGEYSESEVVKGLEWSLSMGVGEGGLLQPGTQTNMACDASFNAIPYTGRFIIDVLDKPIADAKTTKVKIKVTEGLKLGEIIEQPDGSSITNIQISSGSTVSITCDVTTPGAKPSENMTVIWYHEGPWGDGDPGNSGGISTGGSLDLQDSRVSIIQDLNNLDWTLTIRNVTERYNVVLKCVVIPDGMLMNVDMGVVARANITVKWIPDYRDDYKCGPDNLAPNGFEATCPGECCSMDGECGTTDDHCITNLYKEYRDPCRYGSSKPPVNNEDWQILGEGCYVLFKDKLTFYGARDKCGELDATLSSIHSDEEQQLHTSSMTDQSAKRAWIGLNDQDIEELHTNADGSTSNFTYWSNKEPKSDSTGEVRDCVFLKLSDDGKWKTADCAETIAFFCKKQKQADEKLVRPTKQLTTEQPTENPTTKQRLTTMTSQQQTTQGQFQIGTDVTIDVTAAEFPYEVEDQVIPGVGSFKIIRVTKGDSVTLTCKTAASSSDSIVWTHENVPISFNGVLVSPTDNVAIKEDTSTQEWALTISDISSSDEGQWICAISGGLDVSASFVNLTIISDSGNPAQDTRDNEDITIDVTVADFPYEEEEEEEGDQVFTWANSFKNIRVTRGDSVTLTCKTVASSSDSVEWLYNSVSLNAAFPIAKDNFAVNKDTSNQEWTLTINDVSSSDEGYWMCTKSSGRNVSAISVVNLTIKSDSGNSSQDTRDNEDTITIGIAKADLPFAVESQTLPGVSSFQNLQVTEEILLRWIAKCQCGMVRI